MSTLRLPNRRVALLAAGLAAAACHRAPSPTVLTPEAGERHLANIRQLTVEGDNAEAYFSTDGRWITFQSSRAGRSCDQQYVMRADGSHITRISNGVGKTTCGYFFDGDRRVFYASTHETAPECPPRPDYSHGYVWRLDDYDIYSVARDGSDSRNLTHSPGYDAEGTLSPDGRRIAFTSVRDGDLDIYTMNVDGSDVRRLTSALGYDGGPFWSHDGTRIAFRAFHPQTAQDSAEYRELLAQNLVRPTRMELWIMNADGSDQHQITNLGGANFAPYFTPDDRRIIFASNHTEPRSRNFDLYLVNLDGTGLEQVTTSTEFDSFPMFSPDGRQLVWASNRRATAAGSTNIFIADWRP